jgi:L-aspartate oxidase
MRGEGAILRNVFKEPFMKNYHPDSELAPRDVVSRAIISEMVKTRSNHVYLDLTHLDGNFVKKRFPRIYTTCLRYDVNIIKDLIPVSPAAHYMMGGVKTDLNGSTNIKGLYAAGEVACTGVHGANRLASNSLLEGLVFGARAGKAAVNSLIHTEPFALDGKEISIHPLLHDHEEIRHALKKIMWEKVGIIRCEESLKDAQEKLAEWSYILNKTFLIRRGLELKNMLTVAILVTEAALQRKGSVGAHYRSDYPERGEGWQRHILLKKDDKEVKFEYVE